MLGVTINNGVVLSTYTTPIKVPIGHAFFLAVQRNRGNFAPSLFSISRSPSTPKANVIYEGSFPASAVSVTEDGTYITVTLNEGTGANVYYRLLIME